MRRAAWLRAGPDLSGRPSLPECGAEARETSNLTAEGTGWFGQITRSSGSPGTPHGGSSGVAAENEGVEDEACSRATGHCQRRPGDGGAVRDAPPEAAVGIRPRPGQGRRNGDDARWVVRSTCVPAGVHAGSVRPAEVRPVALHRGPLSVHPGGRPAPADHRRRRQQRRFGAVVRPPVPRGEGGRRGAGTRQRVALSGEHEALRCRGGSDGDRFGGRLCRPADR